MGSCGAGLQPDHLRHGPEFAQNSHRRFFCITHRPECLSIISCCLCSSSSPSHATLFESARMCSRLLLPAGALHKALKHYCHLSSSGIYTLIHICLRYPYTLLTPVLTRMVVLVLCIEQAGGSSGKCMRTHTLHCRTW